MSGSEPETTPGRQRPKGRNRPGTRDRLIDGAIETLQTHGITGTSARTIAATADVNPALIFYHFDGMDALLAEACRRSTERRVTLYRDRFATVGSLRELLAVGRDIHAAERAEGNIVVFAQLLAVGQTDPVMGRVAADAVTVWVTEIEAVLSRLLRDSPLATVVDPPSLSRAVSAAFIGLELYEGVDAAGGSSALAALDQLGAIVEMIDELGPLARRALRSRLRRATT